MRVTVPVGMAPLGTVAVPATETGVPAGGVAGLGVAVKVTSSGCTESWRCQ